MPHYRREELLTASEIARFVYCQRAWGYDREKIRERRGWWSIRMLVYALMGLGFVVLMVLVIVGRP